MRAAAALARRGLQGRSSIRISRDSAARAGMASYAVPPPPAYVVPVAGDGGLVYPVRRIFCVGRNYTAHVAEMQVMDAKSTGEQPAAAAPPAPPFFFAKHPGGLVACGAEAGRGATAVAFPPVTEDLHHELELVVALGPSLGEGVQDIKAEDALTHVYGYAVGVDLTRRDLQAAAKASRKPWCVSWICQPPPRHRSIPIPGSKSNSKTPSRTHRYSGKDFDGSAPLGAIVPLGALGEEWASGAPPPSLTLRLEVNGERRQKSTVDKMIAPVPQLIAALSRYQKLLPGDLIYTGTPEGVAQLQPGDAVTAYAVAGPDGDEAALPPCAFQLT
mmetsp:Transcript_14901/g.44924  ORF Transcript_14901/g.44924 Transcript_14901/m.44924 type:complete len:330 (-) Transcript_14901:35-1024(-)